MNYIKLFKSFIIKESFDSRFITQDYYKSYDIAALMGSKLNGNWFSELSSFEKDVVEWYAGDGAYYIQNKGTEASVVKKKNTLKRALDKASTTIPVTVYRGLRHKQMIDAISTLSVNGSYTINSFMSTSLHYPLAAQTFTTLSDKKIMAINLPTGTSAAYISFLSGVANEFEAEVLINSGSKLLLKGVEETMFTDDGQGEYSEDEYEENSITVYKFDLV